jgi:hypothetical protein
MITETTSEPEIQPKNFGGILKSLFIIYGRGFHKFVVPMVFFEAIIFAIMLLTFFKLPTHGAPGFGVAITIELLYMIMYLLVAFFIVHTVSSYNLIGKSSVKKSVILLWRRIAKLLGLVVLLCSLGLLLFIIFWFLSIIYIFGYIVLVVIVLPLVIYFGVKWAFILQAVVIENCSPVRAFDRSSQLVEGYWWKTFVILLIIGIISGGIGYGLEYAFGFIGVYSQLISITISAPIGIIGNTLIYYNLRARFERRTVAEAIAELEPLKKPAQ